jgi:hypothetical protein
MPRSRLALAAAIAIAVSALTAPAFADAPRSDATRTEAAARFGAGEQAFARGEYARAGELFEEAHEAAPHHDAAWNAAQSWLRAGDVARAATWLAVFLREAPEGAPDRAEAKAKLDELAPRVARVDVRASGVDAVTVDGRVLRDRWTYVAPGAHRVEGRANGRVVAAEDVQVAARDAIVVPLAPGPAPSAARLPPKIEPKPEGGSGWSPFVVVVGGAVTAGLGATTILLGAATQRAHDDYAASPTQAGYDDGVRKQDLTNGFFWGTVAAGAVTAVVAIILVDWKKPVFAF